MSKIVAICNQKGGTGKTTTSINLAAYVAKFGKKTLLIDIDPQGNSTSGLGISKDSLKHSTYDLLLNRSDAKEAILKTQIENLFIIPSNVDLTGAEVELVGAIGREYRLKKSIIPALDDYDYILIDCPPSLGLLTVNALSAASYVLIPVQCEYYALEGLSLLLNTVTLVQENLNPELQIEGVVLTMADFRTNLTHEVINEARKYFKEKVYNTVIPRNIRLTEAPSFGKPIIAYDKHSIGALQYQRLAYEFLKEPIPEEVLKSPKEKTLTNETQNAAINNRLQDIVPEEENKNIEISKEAEQGE